MSIQSNGLLFTEEIGECLRRNRIAIGISIDGPPNINDVFRVNHKGEGSSQLLEGKIKLITTKYRDIFSGFLTVINPLTDPIKVLKYLLSFNAQGIDLLLPHHNYQNLPVRKEANLNDTSYADWLIKAFDYWFNSNSNTSIRFFDSIIRLILAEQTLVETIGNPNVDVVVIECNGQIEADDNLRSTYDGITRLGYNVYDNSFNDVVEDSNIQMRRLGNDRLCEKCRNCHIVNICGGGNLPHRYSKYNMFNNPSVYCADLVKLIEHIKNKIHEENIKT